MDCSYMDVVRSLLGDIQIGKPHFYYVLHQLKVELSLDMTDDESFPPPTPETYRIYTAWTVVSNEEKGRSEQPWLF